MCFCRETAGAHTTVQAFSCFSHVVCIKLYDVLVPVWDGGFGPIEYNLCCAYGTETWSSLSINSQYSVILMVIANVLKPCLSTIHYEDELVSQAFIMPLSIKKAGKFSLFCISVFI